MTAVLDEIKGHFLQGVKSGAEMDLDAGGLEIFEIAFEKTIHNLLGSPDEGPGADPNAYYDDAWNRQTSGQLREYVDAHGKIIGQVAGALARGEGSDSVRAKDFANATHCVIEWARIRCDGQVPGPSCEGYSGMADFGDLTRHEIT